MPEVMEDLAFVVLTLAFFGAALLCVQGCEVIVGRILGDEAEGSP
jgi:hypothetical protein